MWLEHSIWRNPHADITLAVMSKILSSLAESAMLEAVGGGGGAGFGGASESPRTMFTRQYSIRAMNTNTVQTDMKASMAFKYETGGKEAWLLACCVDRVSNEVTPRVTLAGAASGFIQNDTHCESGSECSCEKWRNSVAKWQRTRTSMFLSLTDMMTIKQVGTYVWNR